MNCDECGLNLDVDWVGLKDKLALAVEGLDAALDLAKVPEHMQDELWYAEETRLKELHATLKGPDGCKKETV